MNQIGTELIGDPAPVPDGYVKVREAAKYFSISRDVLYRLMRSKRLDFLKVPGGRRVQLDAVKAALESAAEKEI